MSDHENREPTADKPDRDSASPHFPILFVKYVQYFANRRTAQTIEKSTAAADRSIRLALATAPILGQPPSAGRARFGGVRAVCRR